MGASVPEDKKKRRGRGDGAVYQRHDHPSCPPVADVTGDDGEPAKVRPGHHCRGSWYGQIDLGYVGSKRKRVSVTAKTRREVLDKLKKKQREVDAGVLSDNATVEEWLNHYFDNIVPGSDRVGEHTLNGYRGYAKNWLIPYLGRHRLDKLKPDHVRALYKAMKDAGKEDSTRRQAHAILHRALVIAEREGRILRNPAALVDPPSVGTRHYQPLTLSQARQVLGVLDGDPLAARWVCALLQGMRQGECLGLRWEDVDIPNRRIWIRHELIRIKGKGLVLKEPKSETSKRSIPMLEPVAMLLDATPRTGEYVFYGKAMDSRKDWGNWKALLVKAGVCPEGMALGEMPELHAARGTTASLLDEAKVSDKVIAEILGHSSVQITRTAYIHGNEERHRQAMTALEVFVSNEGDA